MNLLSDTAIELVVALDEPLAFLPGQYVNIQVRVRLMSAPTHLARNQAPSKGVF